MSVVVCKILENGFDIAADSITVRGSTQSKGQNTTRSKLFQVNDMIIGGVGRAEESSLLYLFAGTHRPQKAEELAILEFLAEFSDWKNKKVGKSSIDNSYILGFGGKLFAIDQWLVQEITTHEAIGAGQRFCPCCVTFRGICRKSYSHRH